MDKETLQRITCSIRYDDVYGTGFWIGNRRVITAYHVISRALRKNVPIQINFHQVETGVLYLFLATVEKVLVSRDIAILVMDVKKELPEDTRHKISSDIDVFESKLEIPILYIEPILADSECHSYGYPLWSPTGGAPMDGSISYKSLNVTKWDVAVDVVDRDVKSYEGMSGSPVLVDRRIVGVLIYQKKEMYLNYVSFTQLSDFFNEAQIVNVLNFLSNKNDFIPLNSNEVEISEQNKIRLKESLGDDCILFIGDKFNELAGNNTPKELEEYLRSKLRHFNLEAYEDHSLDDYRERLRVLKSFIDKKCNNGFFMELTKQFLQKQDSKISESHRKLIKIPNGGIFYFYFDLTIAKALKETSSDAGGNLNDFYINLLQERIPFLKVKEDNRVIHVLGAASDNDKSYKVSLTSSNLASIPQVEKEYIEKLLWAILSTKTCVFIGFKKPLPSFLKNILSIVCTEAKEWENPRHFYICESNGESYLHISELSLLGLSPIYIETSPNDSSSNINFEMFINSLAAKLTISEEESEEASNEELDSIFEDLGLKSKK